MTARRGKRPHVVLVHYTAPSVLGGVEQVMGAHVRGLLASGARVTVVAGRGRAPRGARLVAIPEVGSTHPAVLRDLRDLSRGEITPGHARLVARLTKLLSAALRDADVVVAHNVLTMHKSLALAEALAAVTPRERTIVWTHDIAWLDPRYARERHPGDPWDLIARRIPGARYVAVSEERAGQLARLLRMPRSTVTVVPNGVDLGDRLGLSPSGRRLAERLSLLDADPLLLLPARLTRRKRIEVAIDALSVLHRSAPSATLVVTGSPGPHNVSNREYATELAERARGLEGVHLLHSLGIRVSDRMMADLFSLADALVLPSESEGFGIPVLEAAAHGIPVVCSDIPALRELAGSDATYVDPSSDGPAIAEAVQRRLASDPVARLRRKAKGHDWSRVLREHVLPVILGAAR